MLYRDECLCVVYGAESLIINEKKTVVECTHSDGDSIGRVLNNVKVSYTYESATDFELRGILWLHISMQHNAENNIVCHACWLKTVCVL